MAYVLGSALSCGCGDVKSKQIVSVSCSLLVEDMEVVRYLSC